MLIDLIAKPENSCSGRALKFSRVFSSFQQAKSIKYRLISINSDIYRQKTDQIAQFFVRMLLMQRKN